MFRTMLVGCLLAYTAFCADAIRPDDHLTPGIVGNTDAAVVCRPNYSATVRHTSQALKRRVFKNYGIEPSGDYEIDHRIPLSLGGADVEANLWPQPYSGPWNARGKDALEVFVHTAVCHHHTMTLQDSQEIFEGDWIAAAVRFQIDVAPDQTDGDDDGSK